VGFAVLRTKSRIVGTVEDFWTIKFSRRFADVPESDVLYRFLQLVREIRGARAGPA